MWDLVVGATETKVLLRLLVLVRFEAVAFDGVRVLETIERVAEAGMRGESSASILGSDVEGFRVGSLVVDITRTIDLSDIIESWCMGLTRTISSVLLRSDIESLRISDWLILQIVAFDGVARATGKGGNIVSAALEVIICVQLVAVAVETIDRVQHEFDVAKSMTLVTSETFDIERVLSSLEVDAILVDLACEELVDRYVGLPIVDLGWEGRLGVREGNVVTTVVITMEDGLVTGTGGAVLDTMRVERLLSWFRSLDRQVSVLRLEGEDLLHTSAVTVWSNVEEVSDLFGDDGVLRVLDRLVVATMVVISEQDHFLLLHVGGEHGVDEEDWRKELLIVRVNWLKINAAFEEWADLRLEGDDRVLDSSLCNSHSLRDQRIAFQEWIIIGRSYLSLACWIREVRSDTLQIGILLTVRVTSNESHILGAFEIHQG